MRAVPTHAATLALIMQGEADQVVPPEQHAFALYTAAGEPRHCGLAATGREMVTIYPRRICSIDAPCAGT
jgi:hypothetical protein